MAAAGDSTAKIGYKVVKASTRFASAASAAR